MKHYADLTSATAALAGIAFLVMSPAGAVGQAHSGDVDELQEVIVTAQKREQNLQNVGISITAFTEEQIAKLGFVSTGEIMQQVPSLQFQNVGSNATIFDLRGVSQNDYTSYQEPPVAVYSDDSYQAVITTLAGALFDLASVEVDRGPQGTLFGRNATGGLIQFISNKPTDVFEGYASATVGSYGEIDTQGAVSGPLTSWLDARLAFATNYNDGYIKNLLGGPDFNNQKLYQGRLQFLFKLNDDLDVLVKLHGLRNPHLRGTGAAIQPSYPNPVTGLGQEVPPNVNYWGPYFESIANAYGTPGIFAAFPSCPGCGPSGVLPTSPFSTSTYGYSQDFHRNIYGSTVHVRWNIGNGATFTSVTDFQDLGTSYKDIEGGAVASFESWQDFHQFSQELRLNGENGPFKWIAGLYFLDMDSKGYQIYSALPTSPLGTSTLGVGLVGTPGSIYEVKTNSEAVYGQVEWALTNHVTMIGGFRETRDEKVNDYALYDGGGLYYGGKPFPGHPAPANITPDFVFNTSTSSSADQVVTLPSWKVAIEYKPVEPALYYASISRGVKGGGFNELYYNALPIPEELLVFGPEKLTDYEVGAKYTLWDGRARLNTGLFYYDYRNYQSFETIKSTFAVQNYDARIKGGELELSVQPVSSVLFNLGVSRLATRVHDVVLPTGLIVDTMMPLAPKWSVNFLGRYTWHAWDSAWWAQADGKWSSSMYFETYNAPTDYQPSHMVANVSLGYTNAKGNVDLRLFSNNVCDKVYQVYNVDASGFGLAFPIYAMPRTFGASITYRL